MADFNWITSRIATGAAVNNAADVAALRAAGVTHIIDCRAEFDDAALLSVDPQVSYLYNGVQDDGVSKPDSWFQKSLQFALPALAIPGAKIYCHCAAGVNRGPSTAYALIRALGFNAADAEALIRKVRPQVGLAYKADADRAVVNLKYQ